MIFSKTSLMIEVYAGISPDATAHASQCWSSRCRRVRSNLAVLTAKSPSCVALPKPDAGRRDARAERPHVAAGKGRAGGKAGATFPDATRLEGTISPATGFLGDGDWRECLGATTAACALSRPL